MTTHRFEPDHYYITLGSHEPVLRIQPGDSVITTTIDAHGYDSQGVQVATRPNPQTGPFYIEGAQPGDTLVLHLDRLTPNRATGWGNGLLASNVADPEYVSDYPAAFQWEDVTWRIDQAAGVASPMGFEGRLGNLALPLAPMLGCFGVAPREGQALSTRTSAECGGNMDYNGFVSGVTVYFPVFMAGALFFLGDGHALQGDGEISGTGVETAFEVQFTVDLIKGKKLEWPRGENADYIFTVGNARPLDQALQHATTEMLRWLQADYGLSPREATLLLAYAGKYDLGNVFDPAYTMVCKVPKRVLQGAK
jgi:acetamidase/formamidase